MRQRWANDNRQEVPKQSLGGRWRSQVQLGNEGGGKGGMRCAFPPYALKFPGTQNYTRCQKFLFNPLTLALSPQGERGIKGKNFG